MQRRQLVKALLAALIGASVLPSTASARRGRRASPRSVSGSRRRTRRRVRRRTRRRIYRGLRLTSLPYGCSVTRIRGGVTYYYCGNIWYQPAYQGTTVVYIVYEVESGANVDVEFEEDVYE
jgi:hypothetical protein